MMKAVHLICRNDDETKRPKGIFKIAGDNQYTSEAWDFTPEQAASLIGGEIFFHRTKAAKSFFGGIISAFEEIDRQDLAHPERIKFTFTSTKEARNQPWRGSDYSMAWTSGIIDV